MSNDYSESSIIYIEEEDITPTKENVYMIGKMLNFDFDKYPEISYNCAYYSIINKIA